MGRGIPQPGEPHEGVQQGHIQRAEGDRPHSRLIWRRPVPGLPEEGGGQAQTQTQKWPLLRGGEDLADVGQLDGHEQGVEGVIAGAALAQQELLAALGQHAHGGLDQAGHRLQRAAVARQGPPCQRLAGPILANRLRQALHQFLAMGLQQHRLAFYLPVGHDLHSNLFPGFCLAHLEDVQNQAIILAHYSTILCEDASIITSSWCITGEKEMENV